MARSILTGHTLLSIALELLHDPLDNDEIYYCIFHAGRVHSMFDFALKEFREISIS
jgi:hypothetical protein